MEMKGNGKMKQKMGKKERRKRLTGRKKEGRGGGEGDRMRSTSGRCVVIRVNREEEIR